MNKISAPSDRSRLRRNHERGTYDAEFIHAVIDEALICHVSTVLPDGSPIVLPTAHWRIGDRIYLHGHGKNGLLRQAAQAQKLCISVTLLDGLVLARSAMHHSMNYRSVVIHGAPELIEAEADKAAVLEAFMEKITPDRVAAIRAPNPQELKATMVLAVPLDEVSGKTRSGPPSDDPEDMSRSVWAGVIPVRQITCNPVQDRP